MTAEYSRSIAREAKEIVRTLKQVRDLLLESDKLNNISSHRTV